MAEIEVFDQRARTLFPTDAQLRKLASGAQWSEGPVWMAEDHCVLWSDIPNNRMLRWSASSGLAVWREPAHFSNGHTREADGSLLHCSHGLRAIVRTRFDAQLRALPDEIVVDSFLGRRLNSPNDVVVKSDGTIWFTDPPYGILSDTEGIRAESELGKNHVFRFDPSSGEMSIASDWMDEPNGLAFSPDESILYVSDTSAALRQDGGGHHHIIAFDVIGARKLENPRVFAEVSPGLPDGFRLDAQGWIYTSSADSVQVYHPDGTRLAKIGVPEKVGNLTFGGANGDQLFICASTSLYGITLQTKGLACL